MEAQVQRGEPRQKRLARLARSLPELDAILAGGDEAPIAIVHTVEGAHSLQGMVAGKSVPEKASPAAIDEVIAKRRWPAPRCTPRPKRQGAGGVSWPLTAVLPASSS
jgi:hypothetical protein